MDLLSSFHGGTRIEKRSTAATPKVDLLRNLVNFEVLDHSPWFSGEVKSANASGDTDTSGSAGRIDFAD